MRRLVSRPCAALMVLVLLAFSPASLPRACSRCASDCPMHATIVTSDDGALPCHQEAHAAGDDTDDVLRAACGHEDTFLSASTLHFLLPTALPALGAVAATRVPDLDAAPAPAWDPGAPPTAPPRAAVA